MCLQEVQAISHWTYCSSRPRSGSGGKLRNLSPTHQLRTILDLPKVVHPKIKNQTRAPGLQNISSEIEKTQLEIAKLQLQLEQEKLKLDQMQKRQEAVTIRAFSV